MLRLATGKFIPTEKGHGKEIVNRTAANTVIRVSVGKELVIGGFESTREETRDNASSRKIRSQLTIKVALLDLDIENDDDP